MTTRVTLFGMLFGFALSRVGATDYDAIAGLFQLRDFTLAGVMGVAIALLAIAFTLLRRLRPLRSSGEPLSLEQKPMQRGLALGSLLFGAGWALAGTCPGTALAQLGEGRLAAVATLAGILVSSGLVELWQKRRHAAPRGPV